SFHSEQTYHPFFRNQPQTSGLSLFAQVFRIRDTILPVVAPIVLFFGLYALAVVALARRSSWTWHLDDKLISIMNVPVGLLLALRANRGFERYWSGAQCWTQLTTALRNLARAVQNGIHTATPAERQDKRRLMRLIVGVAVATKYALRGENAWSSPELRVLLEHAHADGMNGEIDDSDDSDNDGAMDRYGSAPRRPRRGRSIGPAAAASAALASVPAVPSPLSQHRLAGRLDRDDAASTTAAVSAVNHLLGKFETLLMVPMPRSFGVHMKQILFVYLCALPVWLVRTLGYSTVIVTVTVSLAFFGVDSIASEIEEPFGTEQNDLPLDYWCVKLREDIEHIMR
ncbi:hypothetical protein CXG81DRAFT_664, partial [Caulochytrium protostelioides]